MGTFQDDVKVTQVGVGRYEAELDNSWDLVGWAHNALNKHYFTAVAATTAGEITGTLGSPLMVGATIRAKF